MSLRVIDVDPADTYYSIRDRLLQGDRQRAVLDIPDHDHALGGIDLVLLRRLADRERLEIGLVTTDRAFSRQAKAVGLPTFSNLTLADHYRPGWWRGGRRAERLGFIHGNAPRSLVPVGQRHTKPNRFKLVVFLFAMLIFLGLVALAILFVVPTATLELRPQTQPLQAITDFTADTALAEPDGRAIPARIVVTVQPWMSTAARTGNIQADRRVALVAAQSSLSTSAFDLLTSGLNWGELLLPSSVRVEVVEESFDYHEDVGVLMIEAKIEGLVVVETDLHPILLQELSETLASGYEPMLSSVRIGLEPMTSDGANEFQVTATALGQPVIDAQALTEVIRGQRTADVASYLNALPLSEPPHIDMRPGWWWGVRRLPFWGERIQIVLLP